MDELTFFICKAELVKLYVDQLGKAAMEVLKARSASDVLSVANHLKMLARGLEEQAERQKARAITFMAAGQVMAECDFHFTEYRSQCSSCRKAQELNKVHAPEWEMAA